MRKFRVDGHDYMTVERKSLFEGRKIDEVTKWAEAGRDLASERVCAQANLTPQTIGVHSMAFFMYAKEGGLVDFVRRTLPLKWNDFPEDVINEAIRAIIMMHAPEAVACHLLQGMPYEHSVRRILAQMNYQISEREEDVDDELNDLLTGRKKPI